MTPHISRGDRRFTLRPITTADDAAVAALIRGVMPEFGAIGPGFAIEDPEVDHMAVAYADDRSGYLVLYEGPTLLGGGGFARLAGAEADVCELRKMYFRPAARGLGLGRLMLDRCLDAARAAGYRRCYLETLAGMDAARALYLKAGFRFIDGPLGATGHFGCDRYMLRDL